MAQDFIQNERRALLNALKLELQFCERGGYKTVIEKLAAPAASRRRNATPVAAESAGEFRMERIVFRDSPWCLNYRLPIREHPCSACWLMHFVPSERQGESVPCHHIPLNERGDTLAALGGPADAPAVQEAVIGWLRAKIAELESSVAPQPCGGGQT